MTQDAPTPRALRTMAVLRWLLLGLVTVLAIHSVRTFWGAGGDERHAAHEEDHYYCPMHPQILSPRPGQCPICNMNLEPIPEDRKGKPGAMASATQGTAEHAPHPGDLTTVALSPDKQRAAGIATARVESTTLGERLRVPGVISAPETGLAQVRVRAPGFVEQVTVRQTGVRVTRGQPLAYVYSPDIYRAQEEFLAAAKWAGPQGEGGAAANPTSDIAAAGRRGLELLELSQADIDEIVRTGRPLRAIPVRATASGFVTRFNAVLGSRADPEVVLYEIADLSSVWVIASVHERDMGALLVGMAARFTRAGSKEAPLPGKVALIEPLLDEATRTAQVRLTLGNRDNALRPGQYGEVEFDLPASGGLFVPRDAVIRTGEQTYVYVAAEADHFEPRTVRTGRSRGERIEILEGVAEGDQVVTRGGFMLDSESRLKASLSPAPR